MQITYISHLNFLKRNRPVHMCLLLLPHALLLLCHDLHHLIYSPWLMAIPFSSSLSQKSLWLSLVLVFLSGLAFKLSV